MKRLLALTLLFSSLSQGNYTFAQCKDISASASSAVIEKKALFEDAHGSKHFSEAKGPLNWLLIYAPNLSTSVYIKGAETFDALAQTEKDPKLQSVYIDSLMIIYDLRIKNCGEEANVTNRKALSFFKYHYNDEAKSKEILPLIDRAIELNQDKILDGLAEYYMHAVKISANHKLLDENQVLQNYNKITTIIDRKIKQAQSGGMPVDRYQKLNEDNFAILSTLVKINCDFVKKNLAPEFQKNPGNINLAKNIFNFMLKDKCTEDPLWLQAAETVHAVEKDFGLAKILGIRYLSNKEHDKATKMLDEALQLASNASDKAEIIGLLAQQQQILSNHVKARELYIKALGLDPSKKEFYARIGDMYMNSYDECARQKSKADDRLVFLIAYDMYEKAGDKPKMANAKSSFPSIEEIFEVNYKRGDKIKLATCWIQEETIIRTRN